MFNVNAKTFKKIMVKESLQKRLDKNMFMDSVVFGTILNKK